MLMAPMVSALAVMRSLVAVGLKVQHGRAGGKDAPVHGIGESLLLRKAEAGARRRKLASLLAVSQLPPGQERKKGATACARIFNVGHGSLRLNDLTVDRSENAHRAPCRIASSAGRRKSRLR